VSSFLPYADKVILKMLTRHIQNSALHVNSPPSDPKVGESVVALYYLDKNWYRATVLEVSYGHPLV